jgi:VanZ family protein
MPRMRDIALAWLPAALYMALIWLLSSGQQPVSLEAVPFHDKGVHFMEYGTLGVLLAHAMQGTLPRASRLRVLIYAALLTVSWGVLDEIHQAFVPGRMSETADVIADAIGALAGAGIYVLVLSGWLKRRVN